MAQAKDSHARFNDLGDESLRHLSPIKGYENMPLVSLEEAVKPVAHFFNSLEEYVWIAKKNCENPPDDLTPDESASIFLYTMEFNPPPSLYNVLNKTLRDEERGQLVPWFSYLKLFFTALNKLPSHSCKLWRGIKHVDLKSKYQEGNDFVWWGVTSTTESMKVLENENFLGKKGVRTMISIDCKNGKKISEHSYFKNKEQEVIIMPGSYFKVKSILNPADGFHMIDVEEIKPPFPFIAKLPGFSFLKPTKKVEASRFLILTSNARNSLTLIKFRTTRIACFR